MAKAKNLLILLTVILLMTRCFAPGRTEKPEVIIPGETLTEILTDLYIADGLLNTQFIRKDYNDKDSTQNYMDIIETYGYSQSEFDAMISYLFISNPKKLEEIYSKVLANLSTMEADNLKGKAGKDDVNYNYYTGRPNISLPDRGITDKIEIDIPVEQPGEYILRTRALLYTDDQSINPFINLYYWYADTTSQGHIEQWDTIWLKKSGRSELITMSKVMIDSSATHIKGFLFDHTDQPGHWEKHAQFSNISITKKPESAGDIVKIP